MSVPGFVDKSQFHACRLMFAFKKHIGIVNTGNTIVVGTKWVLNGTMARYNGIIRYNGNTITMGITMGL